MKKLFKLMLTAIMSVVIVLTVCACGMSSDWREVRDNLKDEHFEVQTASTDEYIEEYLSDYYLNSVADVDDVECLLIAYSADGEMLVAVFCKDKDVAKDLYDFVDENIGDFEEELGLEDKDIEFDRDGTVVYLGTEDAIKAAK